MTTTERPRTAENPRRLETIAKLVASLMGEVLDRTCTIDDDFFAAGGDSLKAVTLAVGIEEIFDIAVNEKVVFDHANPRAIAHYVIAEQQKVRSEGARSEQSEPTVGDAVDGAWFPLSFPQRLLMIRPPSKDSPVDPTLNISSANLFRGTINASILRHALTILAERHEMFRAEFRATDTGLEQRIRALEQVAVNVAVVQAATLADARRLAHEESGQPFDMARDALIRGAIIELPRNRALVAITTNHWASDGLSFNIIHTELDSIYRALSAGRAVDLAPLEMSYRGYVAREAETVSTARDTGLLVETCEFWRARVHSADACRLVRRVPAPRQRREIADISRHVAGTAKNDRLSSEQLQKFCARERVSPFLACLAALGCAMRERTGAVEVPVIIGTGNRRVPGTESIVGFFVEPCLLVIDTDDKKSFSAIVQSVRERWFDGLEHRGLPFITLIEQIPELIEFFAEPDRGIVMTQGGFQDVPLLLGDTPCLHDPSTGDLGGHSGDPVDLHLTFWPQRDTVFCSACYDTRLWRHDDIVGLIAETTAMLKAGIEQPDVPIAEAVDVVVQ